MLTSHISEDNPCGEEEEEIKIEIFAYFIFDSIFITVRSHAFLQHFILSFILFLNIYDPHFYDIPSLRFSFFSTS